MIAELRQRLQRSEPMPVPDRRRGPVTVVAAVSLALAGGWFLFALSDQRLSASPASAAVAEGGGTSSFETASVTRGIVRRRVQTAGTIKPVVTAQVGSQLSGQVREIRADFNSVVRVGDVLAVLDAKTFAARIDQATADLDMAKAALTNQSANHDKAVANLRVAERASQRLRDLNARGVGSDAQLDAAQRDVEVARAEMIVSKAQVDGARANVVQRQAVLAQMSIDLERTEIRAPIAGIVISRSVEIGQTVAASLSAPELFRIAQDLRQVRIDAQVNEADIGGVAIGNPATFRVDAHPGRAFSGTVSQVRLAATEENNVVTYTVVIDADNRDLKLYPGMTATVEIETARREDVFRLPAEALRYRPRVATPTAAAPGDKSERREAQLERLAKKLDLTPPQLAAAKERLAVLEQKKAKSSAAEVGAKAPRVGSTDRLTMVVEPLLDERQRALLTAWRDEREDTNATTVWIVGTDGLPVRRAVRVGLVDGAFAELIGAPIGEDERVIVRARTRTQKDRP
ncbi:MAG: efflux RND transporter periplasmic adaptor subunit [Burkholderiales bacterium]|nr:efflux RND transporter periplasmic adaptor subunit [Burkholderiales bacterium]